MADPRLATDAGGAPRPLMQPTGPVGRGIRGLSDVDRKDHLFEPSGPRRPEPSPLGPAHQQQVGDVVQRQEPHQRAPRVDHGKRWQAARPEAVERLLKAERR